MKARLGDQRCTWLSQLPMARSGDTWQLCGRRQQPLTVRMLDSGDEVVLGSATLVAIGLGRYFGSGMMICPLADVSDGMMDVMSLDGYGILGFLRYLPILKDGTFVTKLTR